MNIGRGFFGLMSESEAAAFLGLDSCELKKMRKERRGPTFIQFGKSCRATGVRYRESDLLEYKDGCREKRTQVIGSSSVRSIEEERTTVWTYFIHREFPRAVKIGKSKNPLKRLQHLQTGCDSKLLLIGQIPGDREKEIHTTLADLRIRNEWFKWPDSVYARLRLIGIHLYG